MEEASGAVRTHYAERIHFSSQLCTFQLTNNRPRPAPVKGSLTEGSVEVLIHHSNSHAKK